MGRGNRPVRLLVLAVALLALLAGCATPGGSPAAPQTEVDRIAQAMRDKGLDLANLRTIPVRGNRGRVIAENKGFDIPGIRLQDEPAGTIRIFKGEREAEAEGRLFKLLGAPGPQTKLDYVTVEGKRELILDSSLPNELAQRYISAFLSAP